MSATPVNPLLQITGPGGGFHLGGSFPLPQAPQPGQTVGIGRPNGMRRLCLGNASALRSMAATTITLIVMANAYCIGLEVAMVARGHE